MKKLLTALLTLSLLSAAALPAMAADAEPPVSSESAVTGFPVEIDGAATDIRACVTVPLRTVAEKMRCTVTWDNGTVTVTGPERYIRLTIGENSYFAAPTQEGMAGASLFSLSCAPSIINGSTYVPVELFDALLGCKDGTVALEGGTVKIRTNPETPEQIPNPFTDHATLEDAVKAAGFDLSVPAEVNGSPRRNIQTLNDKMIQVFYGGEENEICIRKGSGQEDISGDYNSYAQVTAVDVNGTAVTMKGNGNSVHLAVWGGEGYTYSVSVSSGMSRDDMAALVRSVK